MNPQRPQKRPATQGPAPRAPGKAPTSRQPAVKPSTQQIHKMATTRMPQEAPRGASTRSVPRAGRGGAAAGEKKNNLPIILGVAGGALVLILLVVMMSGGGDKHGAKPKESKKPAAVKAPDVTSLERDGMKKCQDGAKLIRQAYGSSDKDGLARGVALIQEGNALLDQANTLSGHTYDTKEFIETLKMGRSKLLELK